MRVAVFTKIFKRGHQDKKVGKHWSSSSVTNLKRSTEAQNGNPGHYRASEDVWTFFVAPSIGAALFLALIINLR